MFSNFLNCCESLAARGVRWHTVAALTPVQGFVPYGPPARHNAYDVGATRVIPVYDLLAPAGIYDLVGPARSDADFIKLQIDVATNDESVQGIMLDVCSPGGTFNTCADLAAAVADANKAKPTFAYVADMCAGGAYHIAAMARKVYASKAACVGAVGLHALLCDSSRAFEMAGLKVHVVKDGPASTKGHGTPGTSIGEDVAAESLRIVQSLESVLVEDLARGRRVNLQKARELMDGRSFIGAGAKARGLVDGVKPFDQAMLELKTLHARPSNEPAKRSAAGRGNPAI